jgi:hypothetical protein
MNIFKVLASTPRDKFSENQTSAMLAWLLNPSMDHGLGSEFLTIFLRSIGINEEIIKKLTPKLSDKSGQGGNTDVRVELEHDAGGRYIDIVLIIDKYVISIENKIYSSSANEEQLPIQYENLKEKFQNDEILIMVFLVPGKLVPEKSDGQIELEYNNLCVNSPDQKFKITWDAICAYIQEILDKDQKCEISPLNEYARQTLKAFSNFIKGGFKGIVYDEAKKYNTMNPQADKGSRSIVEIENDASITFIGIRYGREGLKKINKDDLKNTAFQCTTSKIRPNPQWVTRDDFIIDIKHIFVES